MSDATQIAQRETDPASRSAADETRRLTLTPAVDIFEDSHGVTLLADLPGVTRERLDVNVHGGSLTIEAQSAVPTPANLRLSHAEIRAPHFSRQFAVSDDFDTSRIEANLKDGVLRLTIPRREEAKPRRIDVSLG
ncbi:Hsp20/alpha crystallin family protein [Paraburkholderia sp. RL17-381-BIF-C]|jgi:HSP20 family molecular chaperone IbpA|uniref:Hsp20/alpha crystallin family protein n=1 Tax=Paraburkholderia sp. RL17-381-BIF-C TaxID=3031635 RepID=UPI0038BA0B9C